MSQDIEYVQPDEINVQVPNKELKLDRYDIIGLLLLMYGWWRLLSGSWLVALGCMSIGWLLAFVDGPKRDSLVRIIGGVSSDAWAAVNAGLQKARHYLAEKQRTDSSR